MLQMLVHLLLAFSQVHQFRALAVVDVQRRKPTIIPGLAHLNGQTVLTYLICTGTKMEMKVRQVSNDQPAGTLPMTIPLYSCRLMKTLAE